MHRLLLPRRYSIQRILDAFVVTRFATITRGLRVPEPFDLVVGQGATITGSIQGARDVFLARDVVVRGNISSPGVTVVGANTLVEGEIEAGGDVFTQHGARIRGGVRCSARVRIVGSRIDGIIDALGDVEVGAESHVRTEIRTHGRILSLPAVVPEPMTSVEVAGIRRQPSTAPHAEAPAPMLVPVIRVPAQNDSPAVKELLQQEETIQ